MVVVINHEQEEPSVMKITTVGLDLAKNVFQVHAIDDAGEVIVRRSLRRRQGDVVLRQVGALSDRH